MAITRIGPNQSINLASNITGTLPTGNGGTGATSFNAAKILQVANYVNTYEHNTTGTSATDVLSSSGVSWEPSITPTVSTSKILVLASFNIYNQDHGATTQEQRYFLNCKVKVGSGSYNGFLDQTYLGQYYYTGASRPNPMNASTYVASSKEYDHNTTDEVKFKWQFGLASSGVKVGLNGAGKVCTVTFMEIA